MVAFVADDHADMFIDSDSDDCEPPPTVGDPPPCMKPFLSAEGLLLETTVPVATAPHYLGYAGIEGIGW